MPEWFPRSAEPTQEPASEVEPTPVAQAVPLFIARRKREGFVEFGDRLYPETERVGTTTFALKREPGLRHGSLRD